MTSAVEGASVLRSALGVLCLGAVLLGIPSCASDSPAATDPPAGGDGEWTLVWSDEFDSGSTPIAPDPGNWVYEEGYVRNREWQYYTSDIRNAHLQNGFLHIEAHRHAPGTYPIGGEEGQDGSISSASLISRDRRHFRYGYLEMRGRIDTQEGSWPAFWSLGVRGAWPDNGECDIMEHYQGRLLFNVAWWRTGDARWTARWDSEKVPLTALPGDWADQFHTWGMEWDAGGVRLYMDDVLYNEWDSSADSGDDSVEGFQQEHYFILNQAIGGTSGGDASGVVYPTSYEVDYVRLYGVLPDLGPSGLRVLELGPAREKATTGPGDGAHDAGVAEHAAELDDHVGRPSEERCPGGVGGGDHEDGPGLETAAVLRREAKRHEALDRGHESLQAADAQPPEPVSSVPPGQRSADARLRWITALSIQ